MLDRRKVLRLTGCGVGLAALGLNERLSLGFDPPTVRDVPWLREIQTPPAKPSTEIMNLSSLCRGKDGAAITRKEDWLRHREELHAKWKEFLGPLPFAARRGIPKIELIEDDRLEGVIRQRVRYETEPGIVTEAYLCKPAKLEGRAPGIVAFHSTVNESIRQPAGIDELTEKSFGVHFARQGRVVICPRN